jgi:tetratricopeptide (TPR) repeat protein
VGEDEAKVQPFVNDMGEKMNYRVAIDDLTKEGGAMNSSYMDASGQDGIPTAFVVDKDSNIAWIGHPMELEPVLKQVVAGTFDEKKAAAASADKAKIMGLLKNQDFDGAMKAIDDVVAADPTQAGELGALQVQILLAGKKDPMAAAKKAEEIAPKIEDAEQLNEIAWALATAEKTTPETLAAAKKLSESSLEKKKDEPGYLDTLARIYAAGGDFAKATELETKAADKNTDEKMKPTLDKALEAYKAGTLPAAE